MAQCGRSSRYGADGCAMNVWACPRSDGIDGTRGRRRYSTRQTAGRRRGVVTNRRMTDKQTRREVDVDSSRARRETGTK